MVFEISFEIDLKINKDKSETLFNKYCKYSLFDKIIIIITALTIKAIKRTHNLSDVS